MSRLATFLAYASVIPLAACATLADGPDKSIAVSTTSPAPLTCVVTNTRDSLTIATPGTVTVPRSISDLHVTCADPASGLMGESIVPSEFNSHDWENIFTLEVGMVIDWISGAAYTYPDSVMVPIDQPVVSGLTAAPDWVPGSAVPPIAPVIAAPPTAVAPTVYSSPLPSPAPLTTP